MSLEIISKNISNLVNIQKENINEDLKNEISLLEKEFQENISLYKENSIQKTQLEIEQKRKDLMAIYKKESKKIILNSKKKIIEEIKLLFLDKLYKLSNNEKIELFVHLISFAKKQLNFNIIICNKKEMKLIKELIKNEDIKIIGEENISGLIFQNIINKQLLNVSYENLANDIFKKNEDLILELLF